MNFCKDYKAISVHPDSDWVLICFGIGGHHSSEKDKKKYPDNKVRTVCTGGSFESVCDSDAQ